MSDKIAKRNHDNEVPVFRPDVDLVENEQEVLLIADLPGVENEGIEVEVEDNRLVLRGRTTASEGGKRQSVRREFRHKNYERSFTIGDQIDRENIKAQMENGVLTLHLPKTPKLQPRKIKVLAS